MSLQEKQEVLRGIKEYMEIVNLNIENVIEDIRESNFTNNLPDLLDGLIYCFRGLKLTEDIHNIEVKENFLKEKVKEILEAMENEDFNLIADILEYEIMEEIEDLNLKLEAVN